jgi:transcription elongation factor GreA
MPLKEEVLRKQLKELEREFLETSKNKMEVAETGGNLWHDNPSFDAVATEQRRIIFEIDKIRLKLGDPRGKMQSLHQEGNQVSMGSIVRISLNGKEMEIKIVEPLFINPSAGRVSYESPLGKSILGASMGECRTYMVVEKKFEVVILSIEKPKESN